MIYYCILEHILEHILDQEPVEQEPVGLTAVKMNFFSFPVVKSMGSLPFQFVPSTFLECQLYHEEENDSCSGTFIRVDTRYKIVVH